MAKPRSQSIPPPTRPTRPSVPLRRAVPWHLSRRWHRIPTYQRRSVFEGIYEFAMHSQPERAGVVNRIPAVEIEDLVVRSVRHHLNQSAEIADAVLINTTW